MKIPNKRELQQIVINHSCDIDLDGIKRLYRIFTAEPFSFLVIDATPLSDSALLFQNKLLRIII